VPESREEVKKEVLGIMSGGSEFAVHIGVMARRGKPKHQHQGVCGGRKNVANIRWRGGWGVSWQEKSQHKSNEQGCGGGEVKEGHLTIVHFSSRERL